MNENKELIEILKKTIKTLEQKEKKPKKKNLKQRVKELEAEVRRLKREKESGDFWQEILNNPTPQKISEVRYISRPQDVMYTEYEGCRLSIAEMQGVLKMNKHKRGNSFFGKFIY
jgi:hypothetical protein